MATRQEKNTISNLFRLRCLQEIQNCGDQDFYERKVGKEIFTTKVLKNIVKDTQPPVDLWHGLWHQGELACLFGEPNVGKTILAMRIAADIIRREERVIYFDFENAEHQLVPRFYDVENSKNFSQYLEILTLNYTNMQHMDPKHNLLDYIKRECVLRDVSILIIDDITHLFSTGNQQDVRNVLNALHSMTKQLRISILVIAHSKKKGNNQLVNIEQLAGSFECAYSFDSIFSLNRANNFNAKERGITHYIKQHKTRMAPITYDDNNVISLTMKFDDDTSSLTMCNFATGINERQLVRDFGFYTDEQINNAVFLLKEQFHTIREIADIIGISKSKVGRILKDHYTAHEPQKELNLMPLQPMPESPINSYCVNSYDIIEEGDEALLYDDDYLEKGIVPDSMCLISDEEYNAMCLRLDEMKKESLMSGESGDSCSPKLGELSRSD